MPFTQQEKITELDRWLSDWREQSNMAEKDRIALAQMMRHSQAAENLTDGELIDAVCEHVWANLSVRSHESWLLGKMIERFQVLAGIEETPAGITVDGEPLWPNVIDGREE